MTTALPLAAITPEQAEAQSLATGAVGDAILATEQALNGTGKWANAQRLIARAAGGPIDAATHAGLYYGAPAVAFLLHTTTADGRDRYANARHNLTQHVRRVIRTRLTIAQQRHLDGRPPEFAEYDLFYGLVGMGALLLQQLPGSDELGDLLEYVIQLTVPRTVDGAEVPGWWVDHDPDPILPTPGGHANFGMAHGAAGLLALLALACRRGATVDGQIEAIDRLFTWFDQWRQDSPRGAWWPQWVTRDQLHKGLAGAAVPGRPSWCYGAAGIARALQLAAIATNQPERQTAAETALAASLTNPQLDRITDTGMCHGLAGLYQTAFRSAADAQGLHIADRLPELAQRLAQCAPPTDPGFLTGRIGLALGLETARTNAPPQTRWDACLLIT